MIAGYRIGWMILSGNKRCMGDFIYGINMLSNMRLCSNVPAQSIVQTALGGYQSVERYVEPGGRVYEQRNYVYEALNAIEKSKSADKHREDVRRAEAETKARMLKGKVVQLSVRGGENGKLYGSITNDQIAAALKEQHGVEVDKRKLEMEEPIKAAGQSFGTLKLFAGVSTRMIVNVKVVTK